MVKEAIKKFLAINRVNEMDNSTKQEFYEELAKTNVVRGKAVSILMILLEFIVIIVSVVRNPQEVITSQKGYYYIMYLVLIAVMTSALFLLYYFSKEDKFKEKRIRIITYVFVIFILFWNMMISLMDQLNSGTLMSYFTSIIAVGVIIYIRPRAFITIICIVQITFMVLLPFFVPGGEPLYGKYVNTSIAALISCFIGYILFQNRASDFLQRKIIQQKNDQLSKLNEALKKTNKKLKYLSQTDGLTGLYNRRMFDKISKNYWRECIKTEQELSVIMMDIDHFKEYNDNYGHQAGDDCLISLVKTLEDTIGLYTGSNDTMLARYGGEEFILMTCALSGEDTYKLAESIRQNVEKLNIKRKFTKVADYITLSLGVFCGTPAGSSLTLADYIGFSDKALYEAKDSGRNVTKTYIK